MTISGMKYIEDMFKATKKGDKMVKKETPNKCLCKKGSCCPKPRPKPVNTPQVVDSQFVNFMMAVVAAPVVLSWVGLAFLLIIQAFSDDTILEGIEAYKSVLLIVGSPALVIIYKVLELWTAQQNSQIEQVRKGTFRNGVHNHNKEE